MPILGQNNFVSANTIYLAKGEEIFSRPQEGPWRLFTDVMPCNGQQLGLEMFGPSPSVAELIGNRRFGNLREYLKTIIVKPYTTDPSLELDRQAVEGDATGAMAKRLTDFLSAGPWFWDKIATDMLLSNPTGVDGVSILNDSHPNGDGGGTWDNLTTSALSFTSFNAGIVAMEGLVGENGEPLGISPTHLMVGPGLQRTALEVAGADRPVPVSTAGALDGGSANQAAVVIENVYKGRVQVVINRRMTDSDEWLLMDLSKAGVRPIAMGELTSPRAVAVTDPQSEPVVNRSKYAYYIEGHAALGGFIPHVIYGRLD